MALRPSILARSHGSDEPTGPAKQATRWISAGAVTLEDAQEIKQVLVALTRLAASGKTPFILAFDQVDGLAGFAAQPDQ